MIYISHLMASDNPAFLCTLAAISGTAIIDSRFAHRRIIFEDLFIYGFLGQKKLKTKGFQPKTENEVIFIKYHAVCLALCQDRQNKLHSGHSSIIKRRRRGWGDEGWRLNPNIMRVWHNVLGAILFSSPCHPCWKEKTQLIQQSMWGKLPSQWSRQLNE